MKRLIWKCNFCDDVVISYSAMTHTMDTCDCGKSSVDYEEHYQRERGDTTTISEKKLIDGKWTKVK